MKNLITGGTGTVGSAVVQALLAKGETVKVLSRSADKMKGLPAGAEGVLGDLTDPNTYGGAFADFDNLFLLNGVSMTELHEGLAAVVEAQRAGAKRIVYLSVQDAEKGPNVPHFSSKIAIETAIKKSGVPYTILRPNNFHQNDYWFRDAITKYGVYPQPYGDRGLSRIDVRDIARAAVNALLEGGHANKTYTLAGPKAVNGTATAEILSNAFGRTIKYGGNDLDAWAQAASAMMPAWMIWDMKVMYAMFQAQGLVATDAQLAETRAILGREPIDYATFAAELATQWK